jgi:hypothetical protein
MRSAANNPKISPLFFRGIGESSFNVIFCVAMCDRYVLMTVAGNRNNSNSSLINVGSNGNYWSSIKDGINSRNLIFSSSNTNENSNNRANGFTVRCLKDCTILHDVSCYLDSFILSVKCLVP